MTKKSLRSLPVCRECGRGFTPKRRSQRYCGDECRQKYYKAHYFIQTFVSKTCPNCGTAFQTSMPRKQIYHTPECREDARKKRLEAVSASMSAERTTYLGERMAAFERDEFKCTVCGRGVKDGAVLDVVEQNTGLVTMCMECKAGRRKTS